MYHLGLQEWKQAFGTAAPLVREVTAMGVSLSPNSRNATAASSAPGGGGDGGASSTAVEKKDDDDGGESPIYALGCGGGNTDWI